MSNGETREIPKTIDILLNDLYFYLIILENRGIYKINLMIELECMN